MSSNTRRKKNKYHGRRLGFPGTKDKNKLSKFCDQLPQRSDFVDPELSAEISKKIRNDKPILFLPNDLLEQHYRDGKSLVYKLLLMGVLRSGEKAAVVLKGITPFFEVRVPSDAEPASFMGSLKKAFQDEEVWCTKMEQVEMRRFLGFTEKEEPHIRVYFKTLHARKKGIKFLYENDVEYFTKTGQNFVDIGKEHATSHDDKSCYYRVVARDLKFMLAGWNYVQNYQLVHNGAYTKKQCYAYTFECDVEDFKDAGSPEDMPKTIQPTVKNVKAIVMDWDIETDDLEPTGNAPLPEDVFNDAGKPRSVIELDCCNFHWESESKAFLTIAVSVMPAPLRSDTLLIQVKDQMETDSSQSSTMRKTRS